MSAESTTAENLAVTGHAAEQWRERSDRPALPIRHAWRRGQRVDAGGPLRNVDELRIHWKSGTLLLRTGLRIETVYDLDQLEPPYERALEHALEDSA